VTRHDASSTVAQVRVSRSPTVVIVVVTTVVSSRCETAVHLPLPLPGDPALTIGCVKGGPMTRPKGVHCPASARGCPTVKIVTRPSRDRDVETLTASTRSLNGFDDVWRSHGFSWALSCCSGWFSVAREGCRRFTGEMRDAHAVWL
jgi:hypothetical protein